MSTLGELSLGTAPLVSSVVAMELTNPSVIQWLHTPVVLRLFARKAKRFASLLMVFPEMYSIRV